MTEVWRALLTEKQTLLLYKYIHLQCGSTTQYNHGGLEGMTYGILYMMVYYI